MKKQLLIVLCCWCSTSYAQNEPLSDSLRQYELEGVSIFDQTLPDTVWSSYQRHVDDLASMGSHLVLLTATEEQRWKRSTASKSHLLKDAQIVIIDSLKNERVFPLSGNEFQLRVFNDTLLAVIGNASVQWFHGMRLQTIQSFNMSLENYEKHWKRIGWWSWPKAFYTDYSAYFPIAHYYVQSMRGSVEPDLVYEVRDDWTHEVMRSEFKYLSGPDKVVAHQYELDNGVDKEYVAAYMRGFTQSNYFRSLNVRWMSTGDGIVLLDQLQNKLVKWNYEGVELSNADWKQPEVKHQKDEPVLLTDPISHKAYVACNVYPHTMLFEVTPETGESHYVQTLFFTGVEKVVAHGGKYLYIYRPFGSSQKKYLYSEKIQQRH